MMKMSENIQEIATALCKMQGSLAVAVKDSKGYNYVYADYASIMKVLQIPLLDNGLSISQNVTTTQEGVEVSTMVLHSSGQYIIHGPLTIPLPPLNQPQNLIVNSSENKSKQPIIPKRDAHSVGSACTYGRRYSLSAALNIVVDDDDGAAAQAAVKQTNKYYEKVNTNQNEQHQQHVERPVEKPKVIPLTQEETDLWLDDLYTKGFDQKLVDDFLSNSAKRFNRDVKELCAGFSKDHELFRQKFNYWMENKN